MQETKMLDRKAEDEKRRKELNEGSMESEPGMAGKESDLMGKEGQGLQGDEAKAKQLYNEKKEDLTQTMKEGVGSPLGDVPQGKEFERDVGNESSWDKTNQGRGEPQQPTPQRREGIERSQDPKTGRPYEGNVNEPSNQGMGGSGLDERKEKEINEEKKANIPNIPKEGKNEVEDPEKDMEGSKIDENDPRNRKRQL